MSGGSQAAPLSDSARKVVLVHFGNISVKIGASSRFDVRNLNSVCREREV
jgi:hypothetical protein